jgi:hypothetical protein
MRPGTGKTGRARIPLPAWPSDGQGQFSVSRTGPDLITSLPSIAKSICEGVKDETRFIESYELTRLSTQLVEAFHHSLQEKIRNRSARFLWDSPAREEAGDDPHVWHTALSSLEESVQRLLVAGNDDVGPQVEGMMRQGASRSASPYAGNIGSMSTRVFHCGSDWSPKFTLFMATDENQISMPCPNI